MARRKYWEIQDQVTNLGDSKRLYKTELFHHMPADGWWVYDREGEFGPADQYNFVTLSDLMPNKMNFLLLRQVSRDNPLNDLPPYEAYRLDKLLFFLDPKKKFLIAEFGEGQVTIQACVNLIVQLKEKGAFK